MTENLPDIPAACDAHFDAKRSTRAARSVHASNIGHPCERSLVYDQLLVGKKPSVYLQRIFHAGELYHRNIVKLLMEVYEDTDVEVLLQEDEMPSNPYGIGGRIDISISYYVDGTRVRVPIEIKSCNPFVFARLKTLDDIKNSPMVHTRKWPDQLLTYLELKDIDVGLLLLVDKSSFEIRTIVVRRKGHKGHIKALLSKAKRVTALVGALQKRIYASESRTKGLESIEGDLPERIKYTQAICGRCDHKDRCVPDLLEKGFIEHRMWDVELEAWVIMREKAQESRDTWEEADKRIKGHCKSVLEEAGDEVDHGDERVIMLDDYSITVKRSSGATYDIPAKIKEKYKRTTERTLVKIVKNGEEDKDA